MSASASSASGAGASDGRGKFRFSIDRGGTFTDVYAELPDNADGTPGGYRVLKLLSEDPANYADAPREAIRRVLESVTGIPHPIDQPLDTSRIEWIRMGTTVATNALLERKGERTAFVVTKGFGDLLHIGNQSRAKIFDLVIARPDNVYERVVEVDERVMVATQKEGGKEWHDEEWAGKFPTVKGITGETVYVLQVPDMDQLERDLKDVFAAGIRSLAVSLAHSYTFPQHEQQVGELASKIGFTHISLSSVLMPTVKLLPRSFTACADAYLTPCIHKYLTQFRKGFDEHMEKNTKVWFMQSDGGLVPVDKFSGFRAVLSGPAGGVVGYAQSTPIKPKSEDALAEDAAQAAEARSRGHTIKRSDKERFDIAQEATIGFDMGGTSTDVSRFSGRFEHTFENQTAGITIQAPQLDINTVAAGGGSMLFFKNGLFIVGPESAGAHPGPACYRKGGPLTITDANLFLGRLLPAHFPKIFGKGQNEPLDTEVTKRKFEELTEQINAYFVKQGKADKKMTPHEVALGFVIVANEAMCRPIRALTQSKGYDIQRHTLSCFGGAGGQHAASIARNLGLSTIFLHRFSGILSAYGLGLADIVQEVQEPCTKELATENMAFVLERVEALKKKATAELHKYGFDESGDEGHGSAGHKHKHVQCQVYLNLRYAGTDTSVMTTLSQPAIAAKQGTGAAEEQKDGDAMEVDEGAAAAGSGRKKSARMSSAKKKGGSAAASKQPAAGLSEVAAYMDSFVSRYQREYGFTLSRPVIIDDIRVRGIGHSEGVKRVPIGAAGASHRPKPDQLVQTYFEADSKAASGSSGRMLDTSVYLLSSLHAADRISGPAIIIDQTSSTLIEPECTAHVTQFGDLEIYVGKSAEDDDAAAPAASPAPSDASADEPVELDNIQLSIFSHRFMSIAEQMGRTLQRTAISTNIKERLDFSCALFGPDGGLVANAPHLPVHLGAMQEAVKFQLRHLGDAWRDGDVVVSNHPQAGGSHLPDITVMTPVFNAGEKVFFVASRGHHSDIGGISPGSMPPFSKSLQQEGARIISHKLVTREPKTKKPHFDEEGITELLQAPGKLGDPTCTGTRNLSDNLSDLRAQVAANQRGIQLMQELIAQYGIGVVQAYMRFIQQNAEEAVREMLSDISRKQGLDEVGTLHAEDAMDDGSVIKLALTIDRRDGSAVFDFTGTSAEVFSNTNAPPSVTYSAIIYCLRCQVKRDIPLNQGCLNPIKIIVPKGCFLNPSASAAVVGGNVLTSQRVTDVVLRAFAASAASQGCMNNLTFGDESFGYYETIAGGVGAGPSWEGQSGVHSHMTNTRITDPEILERRYPVLLRQFSLRPGSGGRGRYSGGDGVIREIEFLRPMDVGILSERRVLRPYGMEGGEPGQSGRNFLLTRDVKGDDDMTRAQAKLKAATEGQGGTAAAAAAPASGKKATRGKKAAAAAASAMQDTGDATAAAASGSAAASVEYVPRLINLGGKNTYKVRAHDRIRVETPGGGGWGVPPDGEEAEGEAARVGGSKRRLSNEQKETEDGRGGKRAHTGEDGAPAEHHFPHHVHLRTHGSVAGYHNAQEQA